MEGNLQWELDEQFMRLETKWRQKAKQRWFEEFDENIRFFHLTAILQSKANFIHSINDGNGNVLTEWELIAENQDICRLPSPKEIRAVVFNMASFKSPGPDGQKRGMQLRSVTAYPNLKNGLARLKEYPGYGKMQSSVRSLLHWEPVYQSHHYQPSVFGRNHGSQYSKTTLQAYFQLQWNPSSRIGLPPSQENSQPKRRIAPSNKFPIQQTKSLTYWVETTHHVFLCCPFSERVWMLSKWQLRLHPLSHLSIREWFLTISDPHSCFYPDCEMQQEFITSWALTLELIWKARNDRIHGKETQAPEMIAKVVRKNATAYLNARNSRKMKIQTNCKWMPPPAESTEIFTYDASPAELRVIRIAVEKVNSVDKDDAIFESDSAVAIKWITNPTEESDRAATFDIEEIRRIWEYRPNWKFRKIPRLYNGLAHGVSKWAHGANWDDPIPPPIFPNSVFCDEGPISLELLRCDL
ncbi:UNVERIFIED_CONTAM: hypothetical protein Sradi_0180500 [Sesamum radiatum]|uniref:Reverse transcriptase zinc-binding domain-containing protein n=1 Tax=Sesamum radiatum TaxID=300843 RepID=A0AAW2W3H2_SESRA